MLRETPPKNSDDQLALRIGGTAFGLLAGLVVGAFLAVVLMAIEAESVAGWVFFASTAGGAVIGFLSAATGLTMAESLAHFVLGLMGGLNRQWLDPSPLASRWLHWVLFVGTAFGGLVFVWLRW